MMAPTKAAMKVGASLTVDETVSNLNDQLKVTDLDMSALSELEVRSSVASHEHDSTQSTMVQQEVKDTGNGDQSSCANAQAHPPEKVAPKKPHPATTFSSSCFDRI